jgi:hypothetical protein
VVGRQEGGRVDALEPGEALRIPALLVTLLDAGERLPRPLPPRRDFARERLGSHTEIDGRVDGHLGLGFATALTAVDRSAVTGGDPSPTSPLPREFSILVVLDGAGRLVTESGELELRRGRTALVPYAAGEGELEGQLDVLRCLPSEASA